MALTDPQSVTINAIAHSLARVGFGENSGSFQSNDSLVKLGVSSAYGRRTRRSIRIDFSKIAPDPLISDTNVIYSMSNYMVVDTPVTGFTVVEAKQVVDGFIAYLSAGSGAVITQLLGGEN